MKKTNTPNNYGSESPIRIVLADDNDIVRSSLKLFIKSNSDMQLVGEATNGVEAIAVCTLQKPDLIFMDVSMPVLDGIEATMVIRRRFPNVIILAVTSPNDNRKIQRILDAGANDYLSKSSPGDGLISIIRKLMGKQPILSGK